MIFLRDKSQIVCNILFLFYCLLLCVMSISFSLRCPYSILKYSYDEGKATLNKTYKTNMITKAKYNN